MDISDGRRPNDGLLEAQEDSFLVSYDAGEGNVPTLLPNWQAIEPLCHATSIRSDQNSAAGVSPRTAVMIHAHYAEDLGDLLGKLMESIWPATFFITTDTNEKACKIRELAFDVLGSGASLEVRLTPNRGRDVFPFWISLREDAADYDIFFKLHLKRSPHIESCFANEKGAMTGQEWSEDILSCLIPNSATHFRSMQSLLSPGGLAALYPRPWGPLAMHGWGLPSNLHWVAEILKGQGMHGLNVLLPLIYPVGNMFIGSVSSFLPFADYFIEAIQPPLEPLPIDGTMLHGIERCYSYLLAGKGENVGIVYPAQAGDLSGEVRWWSYPLAEYALQVDSSTDVSAHRAIMPLVTKLGLVAMERHHQFLRDIDRLCWLEGQQSALLEQIHIMKGQQSALLEQIHIMKGQQSALLEQIQIMRRSPLHKLLSRLVRGL